MFMGKRLKELRIDKGLTQKELGNMVNVTKVSICCYEKGIRTPNIETLEDLSNALNVKTDYLLGRDKDILIMEDEEPYGAKLSNDDLEILEEIKKHKSFYTKIISNPKRVIELINKKIK